MSQHTTYVLTLRMFYDLSCGHIWISYVLMLSRFDLVVLPRSPASLNEATEQTLRLRSSLDCGVEHPSDGMQRPLQLPYESEMAC